MRCEAKTQLAIRPTTLKPHTHAHHPHLTQEGLLESSLDRSIGCWRALKSKLEDIRTPTPNLDAVAASSSHRWYVV